MHHLIALRSNIITIFFFFWLWSIISSSSFCGCGTSHVMWKFPGQGSNPYHSSGYSGSLNHWVIREFHNYLLKYKCTNWHLCSRCYNSRCLETAKESMSKLSQTIETLILLQNIKLTYNINCLSTQKSCY